MCPQPVHLPRGEAGDEAVKDLVGDFGQPEAGGLALPAIVEQAQLNTVGMRGKYRHVRALGLQRDPQGKGPAGERFVLHRHILPDAAALARAPAMRRPSGAKEYCRSWFLQTLSIALRGSLSSNRVPGSPITAQLPATGRASFYGAGRAWTMMRRVGS